MKISYAVLCSTELEETKRLIGFLLKHKNKNDEVVVVQDMGWNKMMVKPDRRELWDYLDDLGQEHENKIKFETYTFNNNFAAIKNYLNSLCTGDWIFQLDADEEISEILINQLHEILNANPDIELFWVPRINIVNGLTNEHVRKWNWRVTTHTMTKEQIVNYPDWQGRLYKNIPSKIVWKNKVHEQIYGAETFTYFPEHEDYCIRHIKDIKKQEQQNTKYDEIIKGDKA